jgi:hypothetical protein
LRIDFLHPGFVFPENEEPQGPIAFEDCFGVITVGPKRYDGPAVGSGDMLVVMILS